MDDGDGLSNGRATGDALLEDAQEVFRVPSALLDAGMLGVDA
jgi:hypothetical protein